MRDAKNEIRLESDMSFPFREFAELSLKTYRQLPRTGKPDPNKEWTHLAAIVVCHDLRQSTNGSEDLADEGSCTSSYSPDQTAEIEDNSSHQWESRVVSLATGSRCLGASQLPADGSLLHDSHAEVLARRAFLVYLLEEVKKAATAFNDSGDSYGSNPTSNPSTASNTHTASSYGFGSDVLELVVDGSSASYRVKDGVTFHLFVSHTPCGDASIFAKKEDELIKNRSNPDHENERGGVAKRKRTYREAEFDKSNKGDRGLDESKSSVMSAREVESEQTLNASVYLYNNNESSSNDAVSDAVISGTETLKNIVDGDIHRTGAKCVPGVGDAPTPRDAHLPGAGYHVTGALRYKPGRGERTSSMSCTDKIAKW